MSFSKWRRRRQKWRSLKNKFSPEFSSSPCGDVTTRSSFLLRRLSRCGERTNSFSIFGLCTLVSSFGSRHWKSWRRRWKAQIFFTRKLENISKFPLDFQSWTKEQNPSEKLMKTHSAQVFHHPLICFRVESTAFPKTSSNFEFFREMPTLIPCAPA